MPRLLLGKDGKPRKKRWWVKPFLIELRKHGCEAKAIEKLGLHRSNIWKYRNYCPVFKAAMDRAIKESYERIYEAAFTRGVDGYNEPVIYQGQLSGWWVDENGKECPAETPGATFRPLTVKKYSDSLLLALLKARVKGFKDVDGGTVNVNTQINQVVAERFLERAREYQAAAAVLEAAAESFTHGGNGQPMDTTQAAPETNGVHVKRGA